VLEVPITERSRACAVWLDSVMGAFNFPYRVGSTFHNYPSRHPITVPMDLGREHLPGIPTGHSVKVTVKCQKCGAGPFEGRVGHVDHPTAWSGEHWQVTFNAPAEGKQHALGSILLVEVDLDKRIVMLR
jgi:hypothetical protein